VADQLMNQLAVPAQGDLVGQFTRDVPHAARPRRRATAVTSSGQAERRIIEMERKRLRPTAT
jgi:hypothetical protein